MKKITRKERMELKIREARKRKSEERLKELLNIDEQIFEADELMRKGECITNLEADE